jgi:hypothetical protein
VIFLNYIVVFYKNEILPRLFFPLFYLHYFLIKIYSVLFLKNNVNEKTNLILSAGARGWESLEFKELYLSACEYLGSDKVYKHIVVDSEKYYEVVKQTLKYIKCTHFMYDPRTGNQGLIKGTWDAIKISYLLVRYNITPIILSTDLSIRAWRIKSSLVSVISGIVICFVSPQKIHPIFPHRRLYGPFLMPLSVNTFKSLSLLKTTSNNNSKKQAIFIGSLYEPRTTMLNQIKEGLIKKGFDLDIRGRVLGGPRKPDSEYWATMVNSDIVFTTADQISLPEIDWSWVQNLVYRYIEVLASGSLLIAPEVPGVDRYFKAGEHFISFTNVEDAINKIAYYLENKKERDLVAFHGNVRAKSLIESRIFWTLIDSNLSYNSIK